MSKLWVKKAIVLMKLVGVGRFQHFDSNWLFKHSTTRARSVWTSDMCNNKSKLFEWNGDKGFELISSLRNVSHFILYQKYVSRYSQKYFKVATLKIFNARIAANLIVESTRTSYMMSTIRRKYFSLSYISTFFPQREESWKDCRWSWFWITYFH